MDRNTLKENLFREIAEHGGSRIDRMETIWQRLFGSKEAIVADRYEAIRQHATAMFDEMLEEEENSLKEHLRQLSELIACKQSLEEELCTTIETPFEVDPNASNLSKQIRKLAECLKKYEAIRMSRLQELVILKDTEEKLCDILGEEPKYVSVATVPSEKLLTEIRAHVETLKAEEVERSGIRNSLIFEIEELISDMELEDTDLNEASMLGRDDTSLVLSKAKLAALRDMKSHLVSAKEIQINEIVALKERTVLLWDLLEVDPEERNSILARTLKGCGQKTANVWRLELERCETLKALNIQQVISRLRCVIKGLWNDCHLSEEERKSFIYFDSENFDERLLEEHEKEQQRLHLYFEERKPVFTLAKKWFSLWDKMIFLENQANQNTNRYANRGGQLLKEERERKAVQKELPKVESSLEKMITELEERTQKQFTYDGRPLLETIAEKWEHRRAEKENEKEVRKIQSRGVTPLKASNKAVQTPASSVQKRGKVLAAVGNANAKNSATVRRELKMPVSAKKHIRRRSRSHEPDARCEDEKASANANVSVGSYTGFQDYLEEQCRNGMPLRSSVSPPLTPSKKIDNINARIRSPSVFKTPMTVPRFKDKKLGCSKILRPMIY